MGDYEYQNILKISGPDSYYALHRRKIGTEIDQVIFDPVKDQAIPKKYLNSHTIQSFSLADGHEVIGISVDVKSDERPTGFIKDIASGRLLGDRLPHAIDMQFTADGSRVLFVQRDAQVRNARLVLHVLGDVANEQDVTLYEEFDESVWLSLEVSKCRRYFLLIKVSKAGSEMFVADRGAKDLAFLKVSSVESGILDAKFSRLGLLLSTGNALSLVPADRLAAVLKRHTQAAASSQTGRRVKASPPPADAPDRFAGVAKIPRSEFAHVFEGKVEAVLADLKPVEILKLSPEEVISEVDFFDDSLMVYASHVSRVRLLFARLDADTAAGAKPAAFTPVDQANSDSFGVAKPAANLNAQQSHIRFFVDTPFSYSKALDFDVNAGHLRVVEEALIAGKKFDPRKFEVTLVHAPTLDGASVPVTLIHPKRYLGPEGLPRRLGDPKKLLLKSYGCYGLNLNLDFEVANWSLLERGWIIAYAHIRGGSELGKAWHQVATKTSKFKSVEDIVAVSNFLVAEGFTHPSLLCATSNSAGAGLLAAAINQQPDLFKAIHLNAPFLDIRGCLTKPELPLSKSDYHEFGDPSTSAGALASIGSLCPYTNLRAAEYPAMLVTAFKGDYRTPLWNVFKYAAKFRSLAHSPKRVRQFCDKNLAVVVDEGSHLGTSDSESNVERTALTTAFLEWVVEEQSLDLEKKLSFSLLKKFLK